MTASLTRREALTVLTGFVGTALVAPRSLAAGAWSGYGRAIVIDGCGAPGNSVLENSGSLTAALVDDVRRSGLTCISITVGPVGTTAPDAAFAQVVSDISSWEAQIDAHPDVFARVRQAADIDTARQSGRTGLVYAFQDGVAFESDLARLETFHRLGVRVIQPTYNRRNLLGDGCLEPSNAGLSKDGVATIERLNELGILVDLSHCGRQTAADAIAASKQPVAFTHTGCAALADHPRNRTDAELRAVAAKGGVCGVYFMPYLDGGRQASSQVILRHLEHMLDVAGEDHVSIGTDGGVSAEVVDDAYRKRFAEITRMRQQAGIAAPNETETGYLFASDLNTPRRFEQLATLLSARGHSDARIEKILGANLRRVFAATWRP